MKGLRCRRGNYYGEFYTPDRTPPRREYPLRTRDQRAAEQRYLRLQREYAMETFDPWQDQRAEGITLEEASRQFQRTRRSMAEQTRKAYASTLRLFIKQARAVTLRSCGERDVRRFVIGSGYTVKTQETHLQRLETFFRWCEGEGLLGRKAHNPAKTLREELAKSSPKRRAKAKPRRDFFMPSELRQITSAIQQEEAQLDEGMPYRTLDSGGRQWSRAYIMQMLEVAASTGLRVGELCALNREHVELRMVGDAPVAGQVRVMNYEGHETKTGAERIVPLTPRAALILHGLLETSRDEAPGAPVFVSPKVKRRLQAPSVSELASAYRDEVGLRSTLTFHSTRHTYVSWMLMLGLPTYVVKELAGHSSMSVTEGYSHMARGFLTGRATDLTMQILSFYCPGAEPQQLARAAQAGGQRQAAGGVVVAGALTDVLFGGALYRPAEQQPKPAIDVQHAASDNARFGGLLAN